MQYYNFVTNTGMTGSDLHGNDERRIIQIPGEEQLVMTSVNKVSVSLRETKITSSSCLNFP